MKPHASLLLLLAGLGGTACGSPQKIAQPSAPHPHSAYDRNHAASQAPPPQAPPPQAPRHGPQASPSPQRSRAPASPSSDDAAGWSAMQQQQAGAEEARGAAEPPPEVHRPGLGTEWGERVSSRIRTVPFTREDLDTPNGVVTFRYNDEPGVRALLGRGYSTYIYDEARLGSGPVTVLITDDDGDPLPAVRSGGQMHVIGEAGDRYEIRIENNSPARVEIVATVDGLDVIDGGDGSYHKRGYLVDAWDTLTIEGFRDSAHSVAAFRFGSVRDSYANQRGKPRNIGVIGIALFRERGTHWHWTRDEIHRRRTADPFPSRFAPPPRQ